LLRIRGEKKIKNHGSRKKEDCLMGMPWGECGKKTFRNKEKKKNTAPLLRSGGFEHGKGMLLNRQGGGKAGAKKKKRRKGSSVGTAMFQKMRPQRKKGPGGPKTSPRKNLERKSFWGKRGVAGH